MEATVGSVAPLTAAGLVAAPDVSQAPDVGQTSLPYPSVVGLSADMAAPAILQMAAASPAKEDAPDTAKLSTANAEVSKIADVTEETDVDVSLDAAAAPAAATPEVELEEVAPKI